MSKGFRKVILCSTDDHPKDNDKVKGWVESNGGTYTRELTPSTTHLLTSKRAWKQYTPLVKAARRMKTVKIVDWDWLEDSLLFNKRRPLPTERYNLDMRHLQKRKRESARNALRQKYRMSMSETRGDYDVGLSPDFRFGFGDGSNRRKGGKETKIQQAGDAYDNACSKIDAKMKAAGYHIYIDPLHFPYDITLMRSDIHRKLLSKHQIKLYQSNTFPATYSARSIFLDAEGKIHVERIAPTGSEFAFAKECFKKFFKLRTGVEWESRAKAVQLLLAEGKEFRRNEEEALERKRALSHDGAGGFAYVPGPKDFWIGSDGSGFGRRENGSSGSGDGDDGRPFVTMVVSDAAVEGGEVRPTTPVGGW